MSKTYTTGTLAQYYGVPHWQILQLFRRKFLPEPPRIGCYRVIAAADLPAVKAALIKAGYFAAKEGEGR